MQVLDTVPISTDALGQVAVVFSQPFARPVVCLYFLLTYFLAFATKRGDWERLLPQKYKAALELCFAERMCCVHQKKAGERKTKALQQTSSPRYEANPSRPLPNLHLKQHKEACRA